MKIFEKFLSPGILAWYISDLYYDKETDLFGPDKLLYVLLQQ